MKCPSSLTHLYLMHLLHAPCCPYALIPISHKGFFEQLPLLIVPLRPPCQFQLTLAFLLTIAFLLTLDLWRVYFAEPQSPTGPKKRIQGGDCCPRRMSLLRFTRQHVPYQLRCCAVQLSCDCQTVAAHEWWAVAGCVDRTELVQLHLLARVWTKTQLQLHARVWTKTQGRGRKLVAIQTEAPACASNEVMWSAVRAVLLHRRRRSRPSQNSSTQRDCLV